MSFCGVGGFAALGHYSTMILLVETEMLSAVPAAIAGYVAGGFIAYPLNKLLTFKSTRKHKEAIPRFVTSMAIGFLLTLVFMQIFHEIMDIQYILAQLMTTGVVMIINFFINRIWTFPQEDKRKI